MNKTEKAALRYAEKKSAKILDPKEWNDYFIQHIFTGEDLYEAFIAGYNYNESIKFDIV